MRLSYEAYEPMALQELNRLCDDARKNYAGIEHIAICHRLGLVFNYDHLHRKTVWKCGINSDDGIDTENRDRSSSFLEFERTFLHLSLLI